MGYNYYGYLVLIERSSEITIEALKKCFLDAYQRDSRSVLIDHQENELIIRIDNYSFNILLKQSPDVQKEAFELSNAYLWHHAKKAKLAQCDICLEISGEPDPDMEYFNDSLKVIDTISVFKGTYIFDPQAGTFLDEL